MPKVNTTISIEEYDLERLTAAADRAGCTRAAWIREALTWALEEDENPRNAVPVEVPREDHTPAAVQAALPRMRGRRIMLPTERMIGRM